MCVQNISLLLQSHRRPRNVLPGWHHHYNIMRTTRIMANRGYRPFAGGWAMRLKGSFCCCCSQNGKPWISVLLAFLWSLLRGPTTNQPTNNPHHQQHRPISNSAPSQRQLQPWIALKRTQKVPLNSNRFRATHCRLHMWLDQRRWLQ